MKKVIILIALIITPLLEAQNLKTENVFLITLDGLRWQELFNGADSSLLNDPTYVDEKDIGDFNKMFWSDDPMERRKKLLPFFWHQLSDQGQVYGNRDYGNQVNVTNRYWFSYPGYSEILCGFADDRRIKSNDKLANPNITVLEFINLQKEFKGKVAAFGSWDVFPYIINEERSGVYVNAGFEPA
ncbi:MAG: phosphoglyceromutase, partial [Bacteroidetes bacterium]|nr:phosphoglyceromutase [Bacteroidota bacterium]